MTLRARVVGDRFGPPLRSRLPDAVSAPDSGPGRGLPTRSRTLNRRPTMWPGDLIANALLDLRFWAFVNLPCAAEPFGICSVV